MSEDSAGVVTDTPTPDSKRGRPRSNDTIERDNRVLSHLRTAGAKSRKQLVDELTVPGNEVYLSLYRLKRDGHVVRDGAGWRATEDATL